MQIAGRFEYKFFVPYEHLEPLRWRVMHGTEYDSFARKMVSHQYTVRSIYLDSPRFKFYHEKLDGVRVRKKLRIRTYNQIDKTAFLEVKHKVDSIIFKNRVVISPRDLPALLEGDTPEPVNDFPEFADPKVVSFISGLINRYSLEPKVLISYEREAYQGVDDPQLRVTFDLHVRSYPMPGLRDIFREDDLIEINTRCFVLEIKFNEWMPPWISRVIQDFDFKRQAISKYCEGLNSCYFNPGLHLFTED